MSDKQYTVIYCLTYKSKFLTWTGNMVADDMASSSFRIPGEIQPAEGWLIIPPIEYLFIPTTEDHVQ